MTKIFGGEPVAILYGWMASALSTAKTAHPSPQGPEASGDDEAVTFL